MNKTYGDIMVEVLREYNLSIVWYGELEVIHECWRRKNPEKKQPHPCRVIQSVINGVSRSPLFTKRKVLQEGRWVRFFKLKADKY